MSTKMNLPRCLAKGTNDQGNPRCGKSCPPGMFVCGDCANELTIRLLQVGLVARALDDAYLKQQRFDAVGFTTADPDESPVPFNEHAAQIATELGTTLLEAADWIARASGMFRPLDTPKALGRWLALQVSWMRAQPNGPAMVQHLTQILSRAERAIDRAGDLRFVGPCSGTHLDDDGLATECTEDLYANSWDHEVSCRACGATYPIKDRRTWLLGQAADMLMPRTELSRALAGFGLVVTTKQLEHWAARGRLASKGHTATLPARPLYRLGDVLDVVQANAARESRATA